MSSLFATPFKSPLLTLVPEGNSASTSEVTSESMPLGKRSLARKTTEFWSLFVSRCSLDTMWYLLLRASTALAASMKAVPTSWRQTTSAALYPSRILRV